MGKVRAVLVIRGDQGVRRAAMAAGDAGFARADVNFRPESALRQIEVDTSFAPVPYAARGRTPQLAMAATDEAEAFVVRCEVDEALMDGGGLPDNVEIFSDPTVASFNPICGGDGPVGTALDVGRNLGVADLHRAGLDGAGVGLVICDTGINSAHLAAKGLQPALDATFAWRPSGSFAAPGQSAVGHGTMCAFDALIAAPNATLIDMPLLQSQRTGGSGMDGVLSDAIAGYGQLLNLIRSGLYKHLVVNNSWGMYQLAWDFPAGHPGRYADNPRHPFNIAVAVLARAGADILFAAGNCGPACPDPRCQRTDRFSITGANAHPDVTTVAAVSVRRTSIGYSSQGPGIPGMASQKPDISAYSHFLGSEAYGRGVADTGTSTACPVAAGVVAAFRSHRAMASFSTSDLARELRYDAIARSSPARWSPIRGHGIISPLDTARRLGLAGM